jgi:ATP-dependent RNA helicase MRH4
MGAYLSERSVPNIVVTGSGIKPQVNKAARDGPRVHGSNKHLAGFLKPMPNKKSPSDSQSSFAGAKEEVLKGGETEGQSPLVLLSTSLLARGLDFDPSVSHVFVLDPPRNTADFLHRAGRTARAGGRGKVVVFGKGDGRGAGKLRKMRQNLAALKTLARPR